MSNIKKAFEQGTALIPFITCGDPDLETTAAAVCAAAEQGADLIELGIPFSDPAAEDPAIQESSLRALKGGVTTDQIFHLVKKLRSSVSIPMVFVTYSNMVFSYGAERFLSTCKEVEIDGLILLDLPFEEKEEFLPLCHTYGVDLISIIAPESQNRISMIAKEGEGFLSLLSIPNPTETEHERTLALASAVEIIRRSAQVPCVIHAGITTLEQVRKMGKISDGLIVDLPIARLLETHGKNAPGYIGQYIKSMKDCMR